MCIKPPFTYSTQKEFHVNLIEWIGDVLYDRLPDHGYEIRDEQIYTAFQIADAFCHKKIHLAEAGLGTGKTFAYLLSAIPFARYTGKPVVISCASTALQEQLASESGDIAKLSKLLGLEVDARMAKNPKQFVCDIRANESIETLGERAEEVYKWLEQTTSGERQEIPYLSDEMWKKIAWNEGMRCDICVNRGYCKIVRARAHYRKAQDLIIVDHETFFYDLWTREEKLANGLQPILPSYSGVIFDEGHQILLPAALQAGQQIIKQDIETMIRALEGIQGARESFYIALENLEEQARRFFHKAKQSIETKALGERQSIQLNPELLGVANNLRIACDNLLMELQIEQELYLECIPISLIQGYEGMIEGVMKGLAMLCKSAGDEVIFWLESGEESLVVVPRHLQKLLDQMLYTKKLPIIFSSATLSSQGDFEYFIRKMGLKAPSSSSIGSPFDMEKQVKIAFTTFKEATSKDAHNRSERIEKLRELLKNNEGRALVLTRTLSEVGQIRKQLQRSTLPFEVLYEDQADRGYLIRKFKENETSVLVSSSFWEGIDVPGNALTLVVIWELPFPVADPLIEAQCKEVKAQGLDPVTRVEYPEMGLKLKQGCGRLIRTETDRGNIVFMDKVLGEKWEQVVRSALPEGAECLY
ncbi:helicase [Sporanaerobium hydrogeniformans]|uniref:Helicase n=1 Tax=Sporanaerobium hydrogeniformans TaxID=3072179 RepID=A0AC61DEY2_9FIRM|nr:ATP-dependent DNA helicase [Sporanaerobium hydrogeniformans]PHV71849.1 helicase [Sporanaerobium hydrogeniformans]